MFCLLKIYAKINLAKEVFKKVYQAAKIEPALSFLSSDSCFNNLNNLVRTGVSQQSKTLQAWSNFTRQFFIFFVNV